MPSIYDKFESYKQELKICIEDGTIKDPALYWAGKMSQFIQIFSYTSLLNLDPNHLQLMKKCSEEYNAIIFSRM